MPSAHPTSGLNKRDNNNFNPRVGFAWHPQQKWVFRGGFGFYTVDVKFPAERGNYDEYIAIQNVEANPGDPPRSTRSAGPRPRRHSAPARTEPHPIRARTSAAGSVEWWDPNLQNAT